MESQPSNKVMPLPCWRCGRPGRVHIDWRGEMIRASVYCSSGGECVDPVTVVTMARDLDGILNSRDCAVIEWNRNVVTLLESRQ